MQATAATDSLAGDVLVLRLDEQAQRLTVVPGAEDDLQAVGWAYDDAWTRCHTELGWLSPFHLRGHQCRLGYHRGAGGQ